MAHQRIPYQRVDSPGREPNPPIISPNSTTYQHATEFPLHPFTSSSSSSSLKGNNTSTGLKGLKNVFLRSRSQSSSRRNEHEKPKRKSLFSLVSWKWIFIPLAFLLLLIITRVPFVRVKEVNRGVLQSTKSYVFSKLYPPKPQISRSRYKVKRRPEAPRRAPLPASVILQHDNDHKVKKNGRLVVNLSSSTHPIHQLIRDARRAWDDKNARQSRTLEQAVKEYKRRYKQNPPKGFDKWWRFAIENEVQLPDEYDQIIKDVKIFGALSPREIKSRTETASKLHDTYTIKVQRGVVSSKINPGLDGKIIHGADDRMWGQVDLIKPIAAHLEDFIATYSVHDTASTIIGWDHKKELQDHLVDREYFGEDSADEVDISRRGWKVACPPNTPLSRYLPIDVPAHTSPAKTFISSHSKLFDLCQNPSLIPLHGLLAEKDHHVSTLQPYFCLSKTSLHADILGVPTEQWTEPKEHQLTWEAKTEEKLFWRGSTTGSLFTKESDWSHSHRIRMVRLANERNGHTTVLPLPGRSGPLNSYLEEMDNAYITEKYLDIKFSGPPVQCSAEDGSCDKLDKEFEMKTWITHDDALRYRYVVDVDGNAWSARFQRLLMSGSLIFKATVTPEWWNDRIQPWVHYIPIQLDYTDLLDAYRFFRGDDAGTNGSPLLAQQIATEGHNWALTHWRQVDMTAYVFRLYLEWARLLSNNRGSMDFVYHPDMEVSA